MVQGHYIPTTQGHRICEVGTEILNMNAEDKDFTQRSYLKLSLSLGHWLSAYRNRSTQTHSTGHRCWCFRQGSSKFDLWSIQLDSRSLHTLYPQSLIVNFSPTWRKEKELHVYSKQVKSGQTDGWTFHGQTDHNRASTEH